MVKKEFGLDYKYCLKSPFKFEINGKNLREFKLSDYSKARFPLNQFRSRSNEINKA